MVGGRSNDGTAGGDSGLQPGYRHPPVVLAAGADVGIPGLRLYCCRHTFGTRLRQGGADPVQVQALLGHVSVDTAARYFCSGPAENAAVIERIFDH